MQPRFVQKKNGKRLVFSETSFQKIAQILQELQTRVKARLCVFADMNGYPISQSGDPQRIDISSMTAVAAGTFSATAEMSKMISSEDRFQYIFHEGSKENIYLSSLGEHYLLIVLFDHSVAVGLVRLFTRHALEKISGLMNDLEAESEKATQFFDVEFRTLLDKELDRTFGL